MKKPKQVVLEFSPDRDGAVGTMDEFTRQMNGLARGIAAGRVKGNDARTRLRAEPPGRPRQR
jgi:hypothetical protein